LREHGPRFTQAGVRLALVVQASAERLPEVSGYSRDFTCIPDPKRSTHAQLGLRRMSLWKMLTSGGLRRAFRRSRASGHRQHWKRTMYKESSWTLVPAAALIGPKGRILWAYEGEHNGDLPPLDNLLAVAQEHWDPSRSERRPSW